MARRQGRSWASRRGQHDCWHVSASGARHRALAARDPGKRRAQYMTRRPLMLRTRLTWFVRTAQRRRPRGAIYLHDVERLPMIQYISAVTLTVRAMPEALTFYTTLGFTLIFGGPQSLFSTLQAGDAFINLTVVSTYTPTWWGRTIFRVDDVDALYQRVCARGLTPAAPPQNARWGERYFHLTDPNGHELSFAQLLPTPS